MSEGEAPKEVRSAARILEIVGILPLATAIVTVVGMPFWNLDPGGVRRCLILSAVLMVKGVIFLLVARAVRRRRAWGRALGLVLGFLCCFAFPIGTMIGVVIVTQLLNPEAAAWFSRRGHRLEQATLNPSSN